MNEIRIVIRCQKDDDHAKVLRFDPHLGFEWVWTLAGLLDGTSPFYIYPPGEGSPIGKCAICGAPYTCTVLEINDGQAPDIKKNLQESLHAQSEQPNG
jgi:hypothetical protein